MSEEAQTADTSITEPAEQQADVSRGTPPVEAPATPKWYYADGVEGQGEKPEYFNDKKYKSLSEQARAQRELEKKLGGFTGAPDQYEVRISDAFVDKGFELHQDDPFVKGFQEFAKAKGMNQEIFEESLNFYAELELAKAEGIRQYTEAQRKELGSNADRRIDDLRKWGSANLPDDLQDGFQAMFTTAASVEAMEMIVGKLLEKGVNPASGEGAVAYTEADVQKMQFELDQYGNRRIQSDPEFRRKYEEISRKVRGTQEARRAMG